MRSLAFTIATLLSLDACSVIVAQQIPDVQYVFQDLRDEATTDKAVGQLLKLASTDPDARSYLAERLPALIQHTPEGPVWHNAVQLAGDLRISQAVPVLTAALTPHNVGGTLSFTEEMRLDTDSVGKALTKIGDPAVPSVADVLFHGNENARGRAALVLLNIRSAAARNVLRQYVRSGSDRNVRELIRKSLG